MHIAGTIETGLTIGKIVAMNFRTAEVFKKYGIDFCCKGNRQLSDVCKERNLDFVTIENEVLEKMQQSIPLPDDR